MCKIICIASQKGGVGKTATAVNLAAALALLEKRTILIDCDPQCSASLWTGVDRDIYPYSLYHLLTEEKEVNEIISNTELEMLQVIPSGFELFDIIANNHFKTLTVDILANKISALKENYEYIVIDAPPSINALTIFAMTAANFLITPVQCRPYALEGLGQLLKIVKNVQVNMNSDLKIGGVVFTFCKNQEEAVRYFSSQIIDSFSKIIFPATIPYDGVLQDSFDAGKPVVLFDIESKGAVAYLDLAFDLENFLSKP